MSDFLRVSLCILLMVQVLERNHCLFYLKGGTLRFPHLTGVCSQNRLNTSIDATEVALPTAQTKLINRGQKTENREAEYSKSKIKSKSNNYFCSAFSTPTNKSNVAPILKVIMCKNRRSGDRAKARFW